MKCRSCFNGDIVELVSLGDQYLSDFRADEKRPPKYPLDLVICNHCKLVQLKETTPSKYLYTDNYGYESGINGLIRADLRDVSLESIRAHGSLKSKVVVLDIGANDGTLLSFYPKQGFVKIGIDPVPKFKEKLAQHANFAINDFFNADAVKAVAGKADIITSVSMFYDLDDPNQFVLDIEESLAENGVWVCQQNYLGTMLSNTAYCNICHEHIEYYSLYSFERLLEKYNLEVFKVTQNTINGGSFRTFINHRGQREIDPSVQAMRDAEKQQGLDTLDVYQAFADEIKVQSAALTRLIKKLHKEGKTVYVYGASTRGNTLLQASKLNSKLLQFAVERNPGKYGKKISSIQVPIISESEFHLHQPDYILILPWFLARGKEGMIEREKKYLEKGGTIILPLPTVQLVDYEKYTRDLQERA